MTQPIRLLDLVRLHEPLKGELVAALEQALASGQHIGGPAVSRFERELAERVQAREAIGTSSGTDALLVALMALGVKPGDEVITTPYTFFATAGCIVRLGARPVFADIDPLTYNIDPLAIESVVTTRTVGIVPVHLFGLCAEMQQIAEIAKRRGLWVLEDAAQAIGATYRGQAAGSMGQAAAFSFFPAKNLGALGDAGAATTNDAPLAEKMRSLRQHGAQQKYVHALVGGNFRLDPLQAAFLSIKLPRLSAWEEARRRHAARYSELLSGAPGLSCPVEPPHARHIYNQFVIRSPRREAIRDALAREGVDTAVYYPIPLHLQECFQALCYKQGEMPESERAARETLAIPIDPLLGPADVERVAEIVRRAAGE